MILLLNGFWVSWFLFYFFSLNASHMKIAMPNDLRYNRFKLINSFNARFVLDVPWCNSFNGYFLSISLEKKELKIVRLINHHLQWQWRIVYKIAIKANRIFLLSARLINYLIFCMNLTDDCPLFPFVLFVCDVYEVLM